MADYYPLMLDLEDRKVLLVGGGRVAQRKLSSLLVCSPRITLVSPRFTPGIKKMAAKNNNIDLLEKEYEPGDLRGFELVFVACAASGFKEKCLSEARKEGILVNVVDSEEDCDFIIPAVVRRGDLIVAISTSGKSPAFASKTRRELEERYPEQYGDYLAVLGRLRRRVLAEIPSSQERRRIFKTLVDSDLVEKYISGEISDIESAVYRRYHKLIETDDK